MALSSLGGFGRKVGSKHDLQEVHSESMPSCSTRLMGRGQKDTLSCSWRAGGGLKAAAETTSCVPLLSFLALALAFRYFPGGDLSLIAISATVSIIFHLAEPLHTVFARDGTSSQCGCCQRDTNWSNGSKNPIHPDFGKLQNPPKPQCF